jgi:hypothetical protein
MLQDASAGRRSFVLLEALAYDIIYYLLGGAMLSLVGGSKEK